MSSTEESSSAQGEKRRTIGDLVQVGLAIALSSAIFTGWFHTAVDWTVEKVDGALGRGAIHWIAYAAGAGFAVAVFVKSQGLWRAHKYGVSDAMALTTVLAAYAFALRLLLDYDVPLSSFSALLSIVGFLVASFFYRAFSNIWYGFLESWSSPSGEWQIVVPARIRARRHAAISLLGVFLLSLLVDWSSGWAQPLFALWLGVVAFAHYRAISETSVTVFEGGATVLGKNWFWEDGQLALIETPQGVRLAPKRMAQDPKVLRRWPVLPAEHVAAVRSALAQKQPTTDSTDDTDNASSVQSVSSVVKTDPR